MNGFLKILQYTNSAPGELEQLLSWQASSHDEMRENRFAAARNQLHCHDREDEPGDRGAYRCHCQQSTRRPAYAERMLVLGRRQPANSDVLCRCLVNDFLQHP